MCVKKVKTMGRKILVTGITGFVGRHTSRAILAEGKYDLVAIVRPDTDPKRFEEFVGKVEIIEIDLCDLVSLEKYLETVKFDVILHIGALRGGKKFSQEEFIKSNVESTRVLAEKALIKNSNLVFCSSVGVYGGVPKNLPVKISHPKVPDGCYHATKIESEKIIMDCVNRGLDALILRPSIIYGVGDIGFASNLVKLVDKGIIFLPIRKTIIHLTDVDLLVEVLIKSLELKKFNTTIYNVADSNSLILGDLVDFISEELNGNSYPFYKKLPHLLYTLGRKLFKILNNELWVNRFEFIASDREYDNGKLYEDFGLSSVETIPSIKKVIDWCKNNKEE